MLSVTGVKTSSRHMPSLSQRTRDFKRRRRNNAVHINGCCRANSRLFLFCLRIMETPLCEDQQTFACIFQKGKQAALFGDRTFSAESTTTDGEKDQVAAAKPREGTPETASIASIDDISTPNSTDVIADTVCQNETLGIPQLCSQRSAFSTVYA